MKGDTQIDIKPIPHGNSKGKGLPYYLTKHSIKGNVEEAAKIMKPKAAYQSKRQEVFKLVKVLGTLQGIASRFQI